jgi:hypothetical protein
VIVVALEVVEAQGGAWQGLCFAKGVRLGQGRDALSIFCMLEQLATKLVGAIERAEVREIGSVVVKRHGCDQDSVVKSKLLMFICAGSGLYASSCPRRRVERTGMLHSG